MRQLIIVNVLSLSVLFSTSVWAKPEQGASSIMEKVERALAHADVVDGLAQQHHLYNSNKEINDVAVIVIVDSEVRALLEKKEYNWQDNKKLVEEFSGVAKYIKKGTVRRKNKTVRVHLIKVGDSVFFANRHYSGYSHAAALAVLVSTILKPDLTISFGTAGGAPGKIKVGDAILASSVYFLDRLRISSQVAFDWGVFAGTTMKSSSLASACKLQQGPVASQIGYAISEIQHKIFDRFGIMALDMESASEVEIFNQTKGNFLALKVISNGVYPHDAHRMEAEYLENRGLVSTKATESLSCVFNYLVGKKLGQL